VVSETLGGVETARLLISASKVLHTSSTGEACGVTLLKKIAAT
jgi:hypothetical protein